MITQEYIDYYQEEGYIIVKSLFTKEEAELLLQTSKGDAVLSKNSYELLDATGFKTKLTLWYTPGNDMYGMMSRSKKMVSTVKQLLNGEVAHYHSKVMQKAPFSGGAWEWHQDYGYWYKDGFLFPDMLSVMIALTPSTIDNGCLQVLPGSHKMGRIEHLNRGEQVGADIEKVNAYSKLRDIVYCELEPGDALFFHSNLLHSSGQNLSENPRWSIISAYNKIGNKSYKKMQESSYTPLEMVDDGMLLEFASKGIDSSADFLNKAKRKYQDTED